MNMDLLEIRRTLHAHPETGFNEHWTSNFLAQKLEETGLEVTRNIAQTGLVAVVPGRDRTRSVGYRADIDALPVAEKTGFSYASTNGCMHACGHDVHMTVALGVAESLINSAEKPACDVAFIFQPNEEGAPGAMPSGAELMCREGILERFHIERMTALHCAPEIETGKIGVCRGALWAASGRFVVRITGKSGHAAYPERSVDALWAASEMVSGIYAALRRRRAPIQEVVSICRLEAGTAFNVIAGSAQFEGILRGPSRQHLRELGEILKETCQGIASFTHVDVEYEQFYGADAVINDDALTNIALNTWHDAGIVQETGMTMASEDFSHFSERIPCFYAMLGIKPTSVETAAPLHSDIFSVDETAIEFAVKSMKQLVTELTKL